MRRDPFDGQPYYCRLCGAGLAEYQACEDGDCELETVEIAQLRKQRKRTIDPILEAKRTND